MKVEVLVFLTLFLITTFLISSMHRETPPVMEARLIAEAYDKDGNLLWKVDKRDPLTLNFARALSCLFYPSSTSVSVKDTAGNAKSISQYYGLSGSQIAVGTGTTAFSVNDYRLAAPYMTAYASGPTSSAVNNKANISLSASFTFSSAVSITEIGLIQPTCNCLYAREVFPTARQIPAGGQLTVTWILKVNG